MTCEEYLRALDEDRTVEDPAAAAHVDSCGDCREAKRRWEEVRGEFSVMAEEPVPPQLHARIMTRVAEGAASGADLPSRLWSRNPWATPLAALFVGALLGGVAMWQFLRPGPSPSLSPVPPPTQGVEKRALEEADRAVSPSTNAAPAKEEAADVKPAPAPAPDAAKDVAPGLFERKGAPPPPAAASQEQPEGGLSVGEIRLKAAPDPNAPGPSRAPAHPSNEPVGQERDVLSMAPASPPAPQPASSPVVCTIRPEGGGAIKVVQLDADSAPSPGELWILVVQRGGAFYLLDSREKPIKPDMGLVGELGGLGLAPGKYVIRRVG